MRFAAPEQLDSQKKGGYGPKVDMYSLGVVLFDMFRDHKNVFGRELERMHEQLQNGQIDQSIAKKMPPNAVILILKLV